MVRLTFCVALSRSLSTLRVSVNLKTKSRASGHTLRPFVDMKQVIVRAGNGGDGCIAFDRYFCNPHGGPSGGNGGNGGHVIFQVDPEVTDFSDVNSILIAPNGSKGLGSNRHGANGRSLVVKVPLDTQVHLLASKDSLLDTAHRDDNSSLLRTLNAPSDTLTAARGGAGGRGNAFFASANQCRGNVDLPRIRESALRLAERGAIGQSRRLLLRLTSFADVGLVGAPNAGKSTLLRRLTRARPRVAPHPFTTLKPHLGILEMPNQNDVGDSVRLSIADLPGLIEGAAERNAGLGSQFLSLIEGCCLLVYLVDVGSFLTSGPEAFSAADITAHFASQLGMLHRELELFNPRLVEDATRSSLIIGTKIDLVVASSKDEERLSKISACLSDAVKRIGLQSAEVILISARRGDNVEVLAKILASMRPGDKANYR